MSERAIQTGCSRSSYGDFGSDPAGAHERATHPHRGTRSLAAMDSEQLLGHGLVVRGCLLRLAREESRGTDLDGPKQLLRDEVLKLATNRAVVDLVDSS